MVGIDQDIVDPIVADGLVSCREAIPDDGELGSRQAGLAQTVMLSAVGPYCPDVSSRSFAANLPDLRASA
jgi:hypothetical protein